jgi:glutamate carboxypeptidase
MTLAQWLDARTPALVEELRLLVTHETPTGDVDRLDALANDLEQQWRAIGATVTRHAVGTGTHLECAWPGPPGTPVELPPVLLLGHYDTVHDLGTLERNPWRRDDQGRAWGPGTQDMKAGLVIMRHALAALGERGVPLARPVRALLTADEEIGSPTSRALIEARAAASAYVLVFEAATESGALKTSRKGIGLWTLSVRGRAAHAGQHFFDGSNANVALAKLLPGIAALSDRATGTTVNVGILRGGTRANVVAERASAVLDVRFPSNDELQRVVTALHSLTPDDDVELRLEGGVNRPAMLPSAATQDLFARAQACARALGFELQQTAAGGGSDANFTAALGTPTLDGLGAIGAGLHTDREWVYVDSLPQRAALLATLLSRGDDPSPP